MIGGISQLLKSGSFFTFVNGLPWSKILNYKRKSLEHVVSEISQNIFS